MDDRRTFLLEMYRQMMNDINRHIVVIWQSVGVVVGAVALLALSEKQILPIDITVALIVLLCGWLRAHLIDAGFWYNRNLVIVGNIERQFLLVSDLKEIHNYFGRHPKTNDLIRHLKIQDWLAVGLSGLMLVYHFYVRVLPGVCLSVGHFDLIRALPYAAAAFVLWWNWREKAAADRKYQKFKATSPGISIDASGISYTDSRKDAEV
jgi:hypothetical protein